MSATVRLKFCSYNYEPLIAAVSELRRLIEEFPDVEFTTIPLPNKKKYYCVNRSPHVNTNSREQFGIEELSQIAEIKFATGPFLDKNLSQTSYRSHYYSGPPSYEQVMAHRFSPDPELGKLFNTLRNYNVPPGVYCEIYSKWRLLDYYLKTDLRKVIT